MKTVLKVLLGIGFGILALAMLPVIAVVILFGVSIFKTLLTLLIIGLALTLIWRWLFGKEGSVFSFIDEEL